MTRKFREGSEGAAQQKAWRRFYIGFGVIIAALMLITYTSVGNTFFHDWFVRDTNSNWKYLSIVTYLLSFVWVYRADKLTLGEKSGATFGAVALLFVLLSIGLSAGFNFDLK